MPYLQLLTTLTELSRYDIANNNDIVRNNNHNYDDYNHLHSISYDDILNTPLAEIDIFDISSNANFNANATATANANTNTNASNNNANNNVYHNSDNDIVTDNSNNSDINTMTRTIEDYIDSIEGIHKDGLIGTLIIKN